MEDTERKKDHNSNDDNKTIDILIAASLAVGGLLLGATCICCASKLSWHTESLEEPLV